MSTAESVAAVSLALTELLKAALTASTVLSQAHDQGRVASPEEMRAAGQKARAALDRWDAALDAQDAAGG